MLRRIHDPERGASFVEYGAVILLVAAIASIVLSSGIPGRVNGLVEDGLNSISGDGNTDQQAGQDGAPGSDAEDLEGGPEDQEGVEGPEFETADNTVPDAVNATPAYNDGTSTYTLTFAGYGDGFRDSFEEGASEWWAGVENEWDTVEEKGPLQYGQDEVLESWDDLQEGLDYAQQRYDEIEQETNDRFWSRWDNGNYFRALGGYGADAFADTLWRNPISPGGAVRGFISSFYDDEAMEAVNEGDDARADGRVAWNFLAHFLNPISKIRDLTPDVNGPRPGDSESSSESSEQGRNEDEDEEGRDGASCPPGNSFVPGTPVLLADGTAMPIEDVVVGDEVLAFDPLTGEEGPREVTDTITGDGQKTLVTLTTDAGDGTTDTITATDEHPFWSPEPAEWVDAIDLEPGTWLRTSTGTWVRGTAVESETVQDQRVHNLTVEDLHTYYVVSEAGSVLAHNNSCPPSSVEGPGGEELPIPQGVAGVPVETGKGLQYDIPAGTPGLDSRVAFVRVMDPVTTGRYQYPNGYIVYMNSGGQTVNPITGRTVPRSSPYAHIPLP
ncbi:polymorphic toxin-type HINT domain-containing protein [Nocardiopsis sediminis]|uniref:Polymorphic toxin-type HINT domain-containing protein n=1 Tax=Nocardiopsis sediminis TaxID=1778267 RepID=A0ABV8FK63_9ACTN